jgi:hypothetical protein
MSNPDSDDGKLVARAFHHARAAGASQEEAFQDALAAYLERHPEAPSDKAGEVVAELLRQAGAHSNP